MSHCLGLGETAEARKAKPFLETSRFIRKYAPKVAILENVFGLAKRSSKTSSTDEFQAKADLGMDTSSYEEYRAFTLLCKQRDSTWPRGLNGREIEQLDIIYHLLPIAERSRVVTDVVKSLGRRAWRSDGLSPTQGFDVSQIHFSGYKRSFFSLLSGNAMTMPVIGGCLLAVLLTTALRSEFRSCVTEEPQSGLAQSDDDDQDDATDASGSSSNFPQHLRDEWPTLAHSGSGYSSSELEWLYNAPPGRVL
ncbi:unnamed protein product [Durusdinium trenchii]|uniref:DNA (cytosine-5-)-methyltransferase n=1 Tax=Durusdinium trenchii TaxID=1381693 RepID=A0ABP0I9T2_9DINO